MPDIKGAILDQKVTGNTVVTNARATGNFTGQLQTPQGVIPGNGNKVDLPYQLEILVENDKIVRFAATYDMQSFMGQLGLA
jgi:hypothetical protein